ncbi:MAG: hypothetical protein HC933_07830 [Pleurocapsa sp. SU_196_0]|nr:hypothetical protein [Pleurocapsa sp. SU_196_0]
MPPRVLDRDAALALLHEDHGGGDAGLTLAFVDAVQRETRGDPASYFESHWLAFAMETSRLEGRIVDLSAFRDG